MAEQEVLVLRSARYLDSSKVVTFFSRDGGLQSGFARGATSRDNRFGASLEPLTRSRLSLRRGSFTGLVRILHADTRHSYPHIREDYDRLVWAGLIVRFLLGFLPEGHPEPRLFDLASLALERLDGRKSPAGLVWVEFVREGLPILGWGIPPPVCRSCGKTEGGERKDFGEEGRSRRFAYRPSDGAVFCRSCRPVDPEGTLWAVAPEVLSYLSGSPQVKGSPAGGGRSLPPQLREALAFLDRVIGEHISRWIAVADLSFVGGGGTGLEDEEMDPDRGRDHDEGA
ncbi:MAG: DNA repair protein RecO [Leptospirillia bacterium]